MSLRIGIDIGSTTVKVVVLDEQNQLLFRSYERHYSKARERACETLHTIEEVTAQCRVQGCKKIIPRSNHRTQIFLHQIGMFTHRFTERC